MAHVPRWVGHAARTARGCDRFARRAVTQLYADPASTGRPHAQRYTPTHAQTRAAHLGPTRAQIGAGALAEGGAALVGTPQQQRRGAHVLHARVSRKPTVLADVIAAAKGKERTPEEVLLLGQRCRMRSLVVGGVWGCASAVALLWPAVIQDLVYPADAVALGFE